MQCGSIDTAEKLRLHYSSAFSSSISLTQHTSFQKYLNVILLASGNCQNFIERKVKPSLSHGLYATDNITLGIFDSQKIDSNAK